MNPITEDMLVDFLAGELSPADHAQVTNSLAEDSALATRLAELEMALTDLRDEADPELPAAADDRFAAMLDRETASSTRVRTLPNRRRWLPYAAAAAAVFLVFTLGYQLGIDRDADQLAADRTLMLELMDAPRSSDRIRATTVTFGMERAEPAVLRDLGFLLRNDESANVRLAALDALQRFRADPAVADILLEAVRESPPEVVRFELIETLVRLNDVRLLPYLEELIKTDSLPRPVRDAAEMASFKLI